MNILYCGSGALHCTPSESLIVSKILQRGFFFLSPDEGGGEDRGEGQSQSVQKKTPPLSDPLVHPMEEREFLWLRLRRAVFFCGYHLWLRRQPR